MNGTKRIVPLGGRDPTSAMRRLVDAIDPFENAVRKWLRAEQGHGTSATDAATALAEVMATMTMEFAQQMGDLAGAINGDKGVLAEFQRSLQEKLGRLGTANAVRKQ